MQKIILVVDGMTCSACSNGLEKYLKKQNGIEDVTVNLVMGNTLVTYDETKIDQKQIEIFIQEAGFKSLGVWNDATLEQSQTKETKKGICYTILAILLLYISMGHMIGLPAILNMEKYPVYYTIMLLFLTIPFLYYGFDILKSGFQNLIHRMPNMDTLVSIGVVSSFLYSLFSTYQILKGNISYLEQLYFESAAIVIYFIKLGRYIDHKNKNKTKKAIQELVQITPKEAFIKRDNKEYKVTIDEIEKGDIVICRPGEKIAVDGIILDGVAHMDESFVTGESKHPKKTKNDTVIAGSINFDGYLEYKAERIGKDSTISEIVRLVVEATNTKPPIAALADKVSSYFVPAVIGIAVFTFCSILLFDGNFSLALNTFVTILVVACPCSLGLATPLAVVMGEGICASNGILVKKSEVLEMTSKIDTVVLDKTGTITYGTPKIGKIICYNQMKENELIGLVGSIEKKSKHPIGKAFVDYLEENGIPDKTVDDLEEMSGEGIVGKIDGEEILVGNAKLLSRYHIENLHKEDELELAKQQNSIVYVAKNDKIIALIGVNDIIRTNVEEVINELHQHHIQTIMLTGDHKETAEIIANQIGIDHVIADVLPKEKAGVIQSLRKDNHFVMMCGDGINDSPALANANIGLSVSSGNDIATNTADVILMQDHLYGIVNLIDISKKTIRNIKQNLFWAFFYNSLMIPIAIGLLKPIGISINPMVASIAMTLSSLTVILNALRLRRIKIR